VTSSVAVFEAAIRLKSMYMIKSWSKTRRKERKYGNQRIFTQISILKMVFKNGIHSLLAKEIELLPEGALTSFTLSHAYR